MNPAFWIVGENFRIIFFLISKYDWQWNVLACLSKRITLPQDASMDRFDFSIWLIMKLLLPYQMNILDLLVSILGFLNIISQVRYRYRQFDAVCNLDSHKIFGFLFQIKQKISSEWSSLGVKNSNGSLLPCYSSSSSIIGSWRYW